MTPEHLKTLRTFAVAGECCLCKVNMHTGCRARLEVAIRALLAEWEEWRDTARSEMAGRRAAETENAALMKQVNDAMRRSERDHMADADRMAVAEQEVERLSKLEISKAACCAENEAEIERLKADVRTLRECEDNLIAGGIELQARLEKVVEAVRVLRDCTYWQEMVAYQPAMSPQERDALLTLVALAAAQPKEEP